MDRRFLLFIVLSFLVLTLNSIFVQRRRPDANAPEAKIAAEADAKVDANKAVDPVEQKPAAADDALAEERVEAAAEDAEDGDAPQVAAEPDPDLEFATLGSVDKDSGYRMLVTLTNRGAGVRRVELSNPRYLDMHDRGGYLGHLELVADGGEGLLVQAVGAGTPAAAAGLKVGDRIVAAGGKQVTAIKEPQELATRLEATRPGSKFSLRLAREDGRPTLVATLARRPLEVIRPESENVHLRGKEVGDGFVEPPSFLMDLDAIGEAAGDDQERPRASSLLDKKTWQIADRTGDSVTFAREIPSLGLTVSKRFRLAKTAADEIADVDAPAYHLVLDVTIENRADDPRTASYRLDGPNGLPVEGWWYLTKSGRNWGAAGMRDVVGRYFGGDPQQQTTGQIVRQKATDFEGESLAYMGVDSQYFCVAMLPQLDEGAPGWTSAVRPIMYGEPPDSRAGEDHYQNVSFRLIGKPLALEPGQSVTHSYQVFAGPKRPDLLTKYAAADDPAYTLNDFNYYGWFSAVSKAMIGLLHTFYAVVGNYGLAIIMLTVLVRSCMFPISRAQAKSMAKMQELKPEMDKIKEKFKGDQQKQAQAMQQLYRKHNVNPLAGCLPLFLQLPVMVGLWRGLAVDVELRQAPLLGSGIRWCSNLAAPDMFFDWSGFMPEMITSRQGFFFLGPYLNLLPLATIALFLWQQKMFMPPAMDEQAKMQQTIMKYMSVLISFMFYKVPSGLCVYLITSSLWSIAERKLVPPVKPAPLGGPAAPDSAAKRIVAALENRTSKNGAAVAPKSSKSKKRK